MPYNLPDSSNAPTPSTDRAASARVKAVGGNEAKLAIKQAEEFARMQVNVATQEHSVHLHTDS